MHKGLFVSFPAGCSWFYPCPCTEGWLDAAGRHRSRAQLQGTPKDIGPYPPPCSSSFFIMPFKCSASFCLYTPSDGSSLLSQITPPVLSENIPPHIQLKSASCKSCLLGLILFSAARGTHLGHRYYKPLESSPPG